MEGHVAAMHVHALWCWHVVGHMSSMHGMAWPWRCHVYDTWKPCMAMAYDDDTWQDTSQHAWHCPPR